MMWTVDARDEVSFSSRILLGIPNVIFLEPDLVLCPSQGISYP